jgi:23S rRNA (adenine2503-C2)-methyltransferase
VKSTPLNPTIAASEQQLESAFDPHQAESAEALCDEFTGLGYDTILSIGDTRENDIGSNCGMSVRKFRSHS